MDSTTALKPLLEELWHDYKKAHNTYVSSLGTSAAHVEVRPTPPRAHPLACERRTLSAAARSPPCVSRHRPGFTRLPPPPQFHTPAATTPVTFAEPSPSPPPSPRPRHVAKLVVKDKKRSAHETNPDDDVAGGDAAEDAAEEGSKEGAAADGDAELVEGEAAVGKRKRSGSKDDEAAASKRKRSESKGNEGGDGGDTVPLQISASAYMPCDTPPDASSRFQGQARGGLPPHQMPPPGGMMRGGYDGPPGPHHGGGGGGGGGGGPGGGPGSGPYGHPPGGNMGRPPMDTRRGGGPPPGGGGGYGGPRGGGGGGGGGSGSLAMG